MIYLFLIQALFPFGCSVGARWSNLQHSSPFYFSVDPFTKFEHYLKMSLRTYKTLHSKLLTHIHDTPVFENLPHEAG